MVEKMFSIYVKKNVATEDVSQKNIPFDHKNEM